MNNKGTTIIVMFMLGVVFFVLGMAIAPALTETSNEARAPGQLDCDNSSISNQDKGACLQIDTMSPVYIWVVFGLAGMLIGGIIIR